MHYNITTEAKSILRDSLWAEYDLYNYAIKRLLDQYKETIDNYN